MRSGGTHLSRAQWVAVIQYSCDDWTMVSGVPRETEVWSVWSAVGTHQVHFQACVTGHLASAAWEQSQGQRLTTTFHHSIKNPHVLRLLTSFIGSFTCSLKGIIPWKTEHSAGAPHYTDTRQAIFISVGWRLANLLFLWILLPPPPGFLEVFAFFGGRGSGTFLLKIIICIKSGTSLGYIL